MPVCLPLRPSTQNLVWDLINMQNVLNQVSDRSSHLTGKCRKNSKLSAFGPWWLLCHAKLQRHSWRICFVYICLTGNWPSVLWRCWLGGRKSIRPEWWGAGVVVCWSEVQTCIWPSLSDLVWYFVLRPKFSFTSCFAHELGLRPNFRA